LSKVTGGASSKPADFRSAYWIISGSGSEDGFMDFQDWVISQGFEVYSQALSDIESLSDLDLSIDSDVECSDFGSAALNAYEVKTGEEMPDRPHFSPDSDKIEWDDEDKMQAKYPRLWAKFDEE
jgi:hypothetical protein